jgi:hypothetical protein
VLSYKRFEQGTFAWPSEPAGPPLTITSRDLVVLLSGVDVAQTRTRRWYDRAGTA